MLMGILWEVFEFVYGTFQPKVLKGLGGSKEHGIWWYAKFSDLVVNLCGFMFGMAINHFIKI